MLRIPFPPREKNEGVSMLRILQPILQLQRGSASAGMSHKTAAQTDKIHLNLPVKGGSALSGLSMSVCENTSYNFV